MDLLRTAPPPADRWSVLPACDAHMRPVFHVVPPPDAGAAWPVLALGHRQSAVTLSATTGTLPGCIYFDLPDPLRRAPIATLLGRPVPTRETAAQTAVGMLAGLCGPDPAQARAHLTLLSIVAATLAQDSWQGVTLSFPDGELMRFRHRTPHPTPLRRPISLPRLAERLVGCPITRGQDLDLPAVAFSPIPLPASAHARTEAIAMLAAALADGPDGVQPDQILDALAP
jgi:hypothetical protein